MLTKDVVFKILKVLAFISVVVCLGSMGYIALEGYDTLNAVYMTVITLTSTGFREIAPLSEKGKIFTIILLLAGVGVVTYSLSSIVSYIASIDFSKRRKEKMEKKFLKCKGTPLFVVMDGWVKSFADNLKNKAYSLLLSKRNFN